MDKRRLESIKKNGSLHEYHEALKEYMANEVHNSNKLNKLQHYYDSTIGLNATDFELKRLSNEIVNRINKEFNLELKTIDSSQMDEFIENYLKTIMFKL